MGYFNSYVKLPEGISFKKMISTKISHKTGNPKW